jgi:hypothetical protein
MKGDQPFQQQPEFQICPVCSKQVSRQGGVLPLAGIVFSVLRQVILCELQYPYQTKGDCNAMGIHPALLCAALALCSVPGYCKYLVAPISLFSNYFLLLY